jgi:thymidylate kinase
VKMNTVLYSDIEQLIKLFTDKPAIPYVFDPYNRLIHNKGEEHLAAEGKHILVNLGGKIIEHKGVPLDSFDLILDFGKAEMTNDFECHSFHYISQNEGHMRWLFQGSKLKSVLAFYNASGKRGQFISRAIKLLSAFKLSSLITNGSVNIYSKGQNKLGREMAESWTECSIFMGTPGMQRSILVALIRSNTISRFLKIPTNQASTQLIQYEKESIVYVTSLESPYLKLPCLYPAKNSDTLCIENLQHSSSLRSASFTLIHASFIADCFNTHAIKKPLNQCEFWGQSKTAFDSKRFSTNTQISELAALGKKMIWLMDDQQEVWTHWAHGDFTPWNMFVQEDKISLYDWELFRIEAPALFDLFHFQYQKGILMDHVSVQKIQEQLECVFQENVLQELVFEKEVDLSFYHRLYLLSAISYFLQVFDQQELILQNQWQIDAWMAALSREYHLLKSEGNCRKYFILGLNEALDQVPHAYLKFDFNSLTDLPDSSDLDIAIEKDGLERIVEFCKTNPMVKRLNRRTKSFMSIVEIHLNDGSFLSLDLIHNLKRKETTMISISELLKRSRHSKKGVMVPALKHDLAYAYAFYTLNNSTIPLRYYQHFSSVRNEAKQKAVAYLNSVFGTSFRSVEELFTDGKEGKAVLEKTLKSASFLKRFKGKAHYFIDTVKDLIYNHGYTVTFSGVDGAGKSTIIEIVKENIETKYRKEVVLLRHRPGILPILSAIKHGKAKAEKIASDTLPRKGKNRSAISSILRFSYYYLDYLLGQIYVYFRYIARGKIVLYDRYYFDFINDAKRSNIQVNRKVATALYRFVMKPKLNIFLYAEAATILARKQELGAVDIKEMTKNYKSLFTALKLNSKKSRYTCIENNKLDNTIAAVLKEVAIVA